MEKKPSENEQNNPPNSIFTRKSVDRINGPEELNDYVRVTTPSVWFILTAVTLLVIGLLGWCIFGTVAVHEEDGSVREVHQITFVLN